MHIVSNITSSIRLFSDDCVLYRQVSSDGDRKALQDDLCRLTDWEQKWQMSFNTKKFYCMHIGRLITRATNFTYQMNGQTLETVTQYPYLGVTISDDLRWNLHVDSVSAKATRVLNFLRRNISCCPPNAKAVAYKTLERPKLEYAACSYTTQRMNSLVMVQW